MLKTAVFTRATLC